MTYNKQIRADAQTARAAYSKRYIAKDILKFNVEAWVNLNRS